MAVVEVVKYNGGPDVFAWKFPNEELGTWTQLIVNESQEAVLFKGGQAMDVFGPGRHTLETANIPILSKFMKLPFGGKSPFTAEVWFINKAHSLDIKWGTATPIQLQDPKYGIFVPVRSFGQFGIRIADSKRFLVKLVGTLPVFDRNSILKFFRGVYLTKAKDSISSYLIHKQVSILEINAYLDEMSGFMKGRIEPSMEEYGIVLLNFFVNDINVPEDDVAVRKLKEALAKKAEMEIIGYNYHQERSFDTLEGAATNPGSGAAGVMGAGLGLGMGVGIGGAVGGQMGGLAANLDVSAQGNKNCPSCNALMSKNTRFCGDCGYDTLSDKENKYPPVVCSGCGAMLNKTVKFCPECGLKYNPCPQCEADLPEGARTCHVCGYHLPAPCPACGKTLEGEHLKFCPECGTSLVMKCPKCDNPYSGSPKFCPECGEQLQQ